MRRECVTRDAGGVTGHESASRAAESQVVRQSTPRSSPRPRSHYRGHSVTQPGHDLPSTLHQPHLLLVAFVYQVHWTPPPRCPRPGTRGGLSLRCPPQTGTPSVRPLKRLRASQYRSRDRENSRHGHGHVRQLRPRPGHCGVASRSGERLRNSWLPCVRPADSSHVLAVSKPHTLATEASRAEPSDQSVRFASPGRRPAWNPSLWWAVVSSPGSIVSRLDSVWKPIDYWRTHDSSQG